MSSPGSNKSLSHSASSDQSCRQPVFEMYNLCNYEMNVDVLAPIKTGTLCLTRAFFCPSFEKCDDILNWSMSQ